MVLKWIKEQFKDADHANFSISVIGGVGIIAAFCICTVGYLLTR